MKRFNSSELSDDVVDHVLNELGWDKDISIPVANAENKALINRLNQLKKSNLIKRQATESLKEKIIAIEEHKKALRVERANCEAIVDAIRNDIETEVHMRKLSERELGRLKQDIVKMKKKIQEVLKKKTMYENMNYNKAMELEDIKTSMQWDQRDLEKYLEECNHQEDLAKYLNQYTREDCSKADVLKHQLEELVDKRCKIRKKVDEAVIETKIVHVELDKTSDQYRQAHAARKEVIDLWRYTIQQLNKMDEDIARTAEELNKQKDNIRTLEAEAQEKRNISRHVQNDNKEIEKKVIQYDREVAKMRDDYKELSNHMYKMSRELECLKSTITRTARECEIGKTTIKELKEQREENKIVLSDLADKVKRLTEKYERLELSTAKGDTLLVTAEDDLKQEILYRSALNEQMTILRERQYRVTQSLIDERNKKRNLEAVILTSRANMRNLISRRTRCENDLLKLDELIYKTDLNIQTLEIRIANLEGDNTSIELETEMKLRIESLTKELEDVEIICKQLADMIKQFDNEAGIHRLNIEKLKKVKVEEEDKIVAEDISIDNTKCQLLKAKRAREEILIYRNMEKFQLKRLETKCQQMVNCVTDLELRRETLDAVTRNRRIEIQTYQNIMKKDLIRLEAERKDIKRQLCEVVLKLEKIESRFEISKGTDNNENSGLEATLEAAYEKEELKRYGDKLDVKIRKTEKEIRALENTVVLLNACNETFRNTTVKVDKGSQEYNLKEQAENDLKTENKLYSMKRCEKRMILKELEKAQTSMRQSHSTYEIVCARIEELNDMITKKRDDIQKMHAKLERAESDRQAMHNVIIREEFCVKDVRLRVINDLLSIHQTEIMQHIFKNFPDIWNSAAKSYFENAHIDIPYQFKDNAINNSSYRNASNRNDNENQGLITNNTNNINNRIMSSRMMPVSVVNLSPQLTMDDSKSIASGIGLLSSSNLSQFSGSGRSSVKLKLKDQGVKMPPSSYRK